MASRANSLWKKRLREYQAPVIDPAIAEELDAFVTRKKLAVDDAWY